MNLMADVLIVLAVAALAWAAMTLFQRLPFFPLRQVVVTGEVAQVTPAQIEHTARTALRGNFFTVELDEARAAFERLPWVRQADVRRRWPDTLELAIEEHVAVARWHRADGEARLVSDRGEIFAAVSDGSLPILAGPEGSAPQVLARYREFEPSLTAIGRRQAALTLSNREAWQLKLDDGTVLELGRDEARHNLTERLGRFIAWYRPAAERLRVAVGGVVDMRYPNGFALRVAGRG